jgi:hypothetical protein
MAARKNRPRFWGSSGNIPPHLRVQSTHRAIDLGNMETSSSDKTSSSDTEMSEPLTPLDLDGVTTDSLEALQSDEQRKILDIVDHLRRQGLSGIVELPQLVVCGDQSSGKSSVLEAVSNLCLYA